MKRVFDICQQQEKTNIIHQGLIKKLKEAGLKLT